MTVELRHSDNGTRYVVLQAGRVVGVYEFLTLAELHAITGRPC